MATIKTNELSAYTIAKNCSDLSDVNAGMDELKDYFTACEKASKQPTQSLLQKWLREVKGENITPPLFFSYQGYACDIMGFENTKYFKTYEEALENELYECLQRVSETVA